MGEKDHKHLKSNGKYESLCDKELSKERDTKITNSPASSEFGGEHPQDRKK